jgi:C-terminal processing protease CtpA/Prc
MTKKIINLVFLSITLFSFAALPEPTYLLKADVQAWNNSVVDFSFYKKLITNENCKESLQKFAGCMQSLKWIMNRFLGFEELAIVDVKPTQSEQKNQADRFVNPVSQVMVGHLSLVKHYDVVRTIFESGVIRFVEARANSKTFADLKEMKSDFVVDVVRETRQMYRDLYGEFLKSPESSFESIVQFIESMKTNVPRRISIAFAVNQYLENAIDPHTMVVLEKKFIKIMSQTNFENDSFGMAYKLVPDEKTVKVVQVLPGSPAVRAGIKRGDHIIQINGLELKSADFESVASLLSKPEVFDLSLTVKSENQSPRTIELKKAKFKTENIESDVFQFAGKVFGYAKLRQFSTSTDTRTKVPTDCLDLAMLFDNFQRNADGAILDLRGNGGGWVDNANCIAGFLLGPEKIVLHEEYLDFKYFPIELMPLFSKSREKPHPLRTVRTYKLARQIFTKPVVVLVDQDSASASELLAAALRDHNRAVIVGTTTFGKGTITGTDFHKTLEPNLKFDENSKDPLQMIPDQRVTLLATFLRFFSPQGLSHHGIGLTPHVQAFVGLSPSVEESVKMKEADRYLFPISNKSLVLSADLSAEKMNTLTGHHECLKQARLSEQFKLLPESSQLKDMQVLTGLQELDCILLDNRLK